MTNKYFHALTLLTIILFFSNCSQNDFDVDVSDVQLDLEINRFDIEMFSLSGDSIYYAIPKMQDKYGDFFIDYNTRIIGVGLPDQRTYFDNLTEYYFYCDQMDLYNYVLNIFPPNDAYLINSITDAFKHYKYYFPNKNIPTINTCISGFNISVFTGENYIGISLDKYLGKSFSAYSGMFENYLVRRMTKEMLPVDVMRAWCNAEFPYNDSVNTVLTNMIYQGKAQYFVNAMLPEVADTLKWGYKHAQLGWAIEYEEKIWEFMIAEDVLFSTNQMDIITYTGEAPFTTPFQNNSAPKAGSFVGYKIIEDFMKNNSEVTLNELMNISDYMYIYNNSYYQP